MKAIVWDSLNWGRRNAVPGKKLAALLGFSSVRKLQKQIERERNSGFPILSHPGGRGYFRSADPAEIVPCYRVMMAKSASTMKSAQALGRALDAAERGEPIPGSDYSQSDSGSVPVWRGGV